MALNKKETGYKAYFGEETVKLLSGKIKKEYRGFNEDDFIRNCVPHVYNYELKDRNKIIAKALKDNLPKDYKHTAEIIHNILGPENAEETGMFTTWYWLWPVARFVEDYGTDDFDTSTNLIKELTKRHTGEFAIRPYIEKYPEKSLKLLNKWSKDKNFHLRRLSSEGLRPRLPWAKKLTLFLQDPKPVFNIIENLKEDDIRFVKKSVGNLLNDYSKENLEKTLILTKEWSKSENKNTKWIVKHGLRSYNKQK